MLKFRKQKHNKKGYGGRALEREVVQHRCYEGGNGKHGGPFTVEGIAI